MTLRLYYHPFASFCQKALIALYEKGLAFEPVFIDLGDPEQKAALGRLWSMAKFPVLRDEARGVTLPESGVIIEYLDRIAPEPRMIPQGDAGLRARLWERVCDNYIAAPLTKIVTDRFRPEDRSDAQGVEEARALIARSYGLLEDALADRQWLAGDAFSLAECAAAPPLFYANTAVPFGNHVRLADYFERLCARPAFARVVEEARPYRSLFPLEWPKSYE